MRQMSAASRIGAHASAPASRVAEPDRARPRFTAAASAHVVDQRAAHRRHAADPLQRAPPHQDGTRPPRPPWRAADRSPRRTGRATGRRTRRPAPARARPASRMPARTISRHQVEIAALRLRDQRRDVARIVDDVGVGEQDERASARGLGASPAPPPRACRSSRAASARRARPPAARPRSLAGRARHRAGAVAAAVVHQDDPERPGIVLRQQRAQRLARSRPPRRAPAPPPRPAARPQRRAGASSGRTARTGRAPAAGRARSAATARPAWSCRSMPLARNQATASSIAWRAGRGA